MKSSPSKATTKENPTKVTSNPTLPSPAIPPQALPSQAFPRSMFSMVAKKDTNNGWQEVKKRCRFPSHWRYSQPSTREVKPYAPYSRKPSYAQVVQNKPLSPRSPTNHPGTYYYVSPHSPTNLRFPPSPRYPEWRGRCFKCCRTGHSVASCRFQRKCGKCWANGHIGTNCNKPAAATVEVPIPTRNYEPGFDELLADPRPYPPPLMPEGRPQKVDCFIERDEDYFKELDALSKAVVVHTISFQGNHSVDNIANYAVKTGLVTKEEIQVNVLPGPKYLIRLPSTVTAEAFIKATPYEAWEKGLSFQQWTPLEEAATVIPRFKILLELIGVPALLWKEQHIVKAVSQFGVFLGTLEPEEDGSLESWMVAVGTYDLAKIPHTVGMHVGGMQFPVRVRPVTWKRSVLYRAEDFPSLPAKFTRPSIPAETMVSNEMNCGPEEIIPTSKSALLEVCKGKSPHELPLELRQFATKPASIHGHRLHERLQSTNRKDPVDEEEGRIDALQVPATQRLQSSSNTKRNLFHQTKSNSNPNISQESRVRCTPGFNVALDDMRDEVASPVKVILGTQHDVPHGFQQQKTDMEIERRSPRLMRRNLGNASSILAAQSAIIIHQDSSKEAHMEGQLTEINVVKKGNILNKGKEVIKEVTQATTNDSLNSSTEITLKEFKFKAQQKRRIFSKEAGPSRPPKPTHKFKRLLAGSNLHPLKSVGPKTKRAAQQINNRPPKRAQVQLNPEGYFEVKVNSSHVQNLASGCGFNASDVHHIIATDNVARIAAQKIHQSGPSNEVVNEESIIDSDVEEALARFEPDSDDDLDSEEETN